MRDAAPTGKRHETRTLRVASGGPLSLQAPGGRSCLVLASAQGDDWALPGGMAPAINYDGVVVEIFGVVGEFRGALLTRQQLGTSLPPAIRTVPVKGAVIASYSGGGWWDGFLVNVVNTLDGATSPITLWSVVSDELPLQVELPTDRYTTGNADVGVGAGRIIEADPSRRRVTIYAELFGSIIRIGESSAAVAGGPRLPDAPPGLIIGGTAELWCQRIGGEADVNVRWISEHVG